MESEEREESLAGLEWKLKQAKERARKEQIKRMIREYEREGACYIAESPSSDKDYYFEVLASQYLLLGLKNDECPMHLNREMVESLVFYLQNWLKGRLYENRRK